MSVTHVRHRQNNEFLSGSSSSSSSRPSSFSTIFTALPWSSRPSCSRLDFFFDHLIPPLGDEICDFLQFFRIFWTPNGQKRLVSTASTRGPIRSRHVDQSDRATSLSRVLSPRQCLASLSPPSRPPLARADAPARARARRYRPLSPGASTIARRRPLARARAAAASSRPRCRPHCHQPQCATSGKRGPNDLYADAQCSNTRSYVALSALHV
jgi:hypothetical protein